MLTVVGVIGGLISGNPKGGALASYLGYVLPWLTVFRSDPFLRALLLLGLGIGLGGLSGLFGWKTGAYIHKNHLLPPKSPTKTKTEEK